MSSACHTITSSTNQNIGCINHNSIQRKLNTNGSWVILPYNTHRRLPSGRAVALRGLDYRPHKSMSACPVALRPKSLPPAGPPLHERVWMTFSASSGRKNSRLIESWFTFCIPQPSNCRIWLLHIWFLPSCCCYRYNYLAHVEEALHISLVRHSVWIICPSRKRFQSPTMHI